MSRKLRRLRIRDGAWLGGVCAGMAYWLGLPMQLIRMVWFLAVLIAGTGILLYIMLWIFLPAWKEKPSDFDEVAGD